MPTEHVVFNLGIRLDGGRRLTLEDVKLTSAALMDEAISFFTPPASPDVLHSWLVGQVGAYPREARAYALVACGRYHEGATALREFAASLPAGTYAWIDELKQRAERLAQLAENDSEAAQRCLHDWEMSTRAALRISDIP